MTEPRPAARDALTSADVADAPAEDTVSADDKASTDAEVLAEAEAAQRRTRIRSGVEWVAVLVGAVVIALLVRNFLFTTFWIPSGSMEPTLMGGEDRKDRVVVNRLSYQWSDPKRGDIIVFEVPDSEPTVTVNGQEVKDLIKRVVGLPGETIELRDGEVYVDGTALDEPYLQDDVRTDPGIPGRDVFEIPDDAYFVMGDNRPHSRDARFWEQPWVPEDEIVGKAFVRIWPISAFGGI